MCEVVVGIGLHGIPQLPISNHQSLIDLGMWSKRFRDDMCDFLETMLQAECQSKLARVSLNMLVDMVRGCNGLLKSWRGGSVCLIDL